MKHEVFVRARSILPALFPVIRKTSILLIGRGTQQRTLRLDTATAQRMLTAFTHALERDVTSDAMLVAGVWFSRAEIEDAIEALTAENERHFCKSVVLPFPKEFGAGAVGEADGSVCGEMI